MNRRTVILEPDAIRTRITRMAYQICEHAEEGAPIFLVGIQGNGAQLVEGLRKELERVHNGEVLSGEVVIDKDEPTASRITYVGLDAQSLKGKRVVMVDDVINSGRTMMHALADVMSHGPQALKTAVLVNRTHRRFPVHADYVGLAVSTTLKERVEVEWEQQDNPVAYLI